MSATLQQRLDEVLERIDRAGARPARILLTDADRDDFRAQTGVTGQSYRGVPIADGQIGGSSYVEAEGTPSGKTDFAI